jgi:hypothetical protein
MKMKYRFGLLLVLVFLSLRTNAQQWSAIGKFLPAGIASTYYDSVSDNLILVGDFSIFNNDTICGIGKWNGTTITGIGCGVGWDCHSTITSFYPTTRAVIRYNNDLFLAGGFLTAENNQVNGIAKWNGSSWNEIGTGLTYQGNPAGAIGMKIINNELYVFGAFDKINGIPANSLAKYDGNMWSAVHNFPLFSNDTMLPNYVDDIEFYKGNLYVCGIFADHLNDSIHNIVMWNGAQWVSVGYGIRGSISFVNKMQTFNDELIVGGYFNKSGDANNPGNFIAKWNGSNWSELGSGLDDRVHDIKVHQNKVFVTGVFKTAGAISAEGIAIWDGTNWCSLGTKIDNVVNAVAFYHDTLYIGGGFWTINNDSISKFAKWIGGNYVDTCSNYAGITDVKNETNKIIVYPNPITENSIVKFPDKIINGYFIIYDVSGKEIKTYECNNTSELQISNAGLAGGMYFFKVTDDSKYLGCGKFIVR